MMWRARLEELTDRAGDRLGRALDVLVDVVGSDRQTFITLAGVVFLVALVLIGKGFYRLLTL